ncbi:MAG: tryptophan--tRNA ligase [Candidatus Paceibacterota bacterium]|jgi:tryptophanyl-tRNA synthetase
MENKAEKKQVLVTGLRPSANLHIGNYLGAVKPMIEAIAANPGAEVFMFVADIHGLTDSSPDTIKQYRHEVVKDYLALGLNPKRVSLYIQSAIAGELSYLTLLLARYTTFNDLMRVPTLKDKLKVNQEAGQANALLGFYPILMAADVLIHKGTLVPIGEDQISHLEKMREFGEKFNNEFGKIFPMPQPHSMKLLRIMALKGDGKMSKSHPEGALFLTDSAEEIKKKISRAETATEGVMTPSFESLLTVACEFGVETEQFVADHLAGKQIMGDFKKALSDALVEFVTEFQTKRARITNEQVAHIVEEGAKAARASAERTMQEVLQVMKFN